ncbi:MAG TPA: hypothetical protein VLH75_12715, partial [Longimicrobiales bacterium]|nr:hypothetical protein [Longimicrobiales bacterium]
MDRRSFCGLAGSGAVALPMLGTEAEAAAQQRPTYAFTIEIAECRSGGCARGHKPGDVFAYPAEKGRICEWLMDSMSTSIRVLQQGGTLRFPRLGGHPRIEEREVSTWHERGRRTRWSSGAGWLSWSERAGARRA